MPIVHAMTTPLLLSTLNNNHEIDQWCISLQNGDKYCKQENIPNKDVGVILLLGVLWICLLSLVITKSDSLLLVLTVMLGPFVGYGLYLFFN